MAELKMDAGNLGVTLISLTQGFAAFTLFAPKLSEVRKAGPADVAMAHDVRMGEIAGTAVTLGVGGIISAATKTNGPLLIAALVSAGFVVLYESTLHGIQPVEQALPTTKEDTTDVHINRNEPGSLRTNFPYGDGVPYGYDVDRNLSTMGIVGFDSQATVGQGPIAGN